MDCNVLLEWRLAWLLPRGLTAFTSYQLPTLTDAVWLPPMIYRSFCHLCGTVL